ncbi:MAG: hypothetical protein IPH53_15065 [Flavobacteriales bacterium]|nr:hypothetical protein [Flavobacteriales bacterium]
MDERIRGENELLLAHGLEVTQVTKHRLRIHRAVQQAFIIEGKGSKYIPGSLALDGHQCTIGLDHPGEVAIGRLLDHLVQMGATHMVRPRGQGVQFPASHHLIGAEGSAFRLNRALDRLGLPADSFVFPKTQVLLGSEHSDMFLQRCATEFQHYFGFPRIQNDVHPVRVVNG